jgi:dTDP-4-amino-4,6-dideoxygalactose transaminase
MPDHSRIFLSSPHMSGREWKYLEEAFEKNHVFPLGENVTGLEEDIRQFTGTGAATCLSSGTAAIHLALINLDVGTGDEVICSSFTFSASANPIVYQNATPVFVDSEPDTWNMSPELLEEAIRDRIRKGKTPKAIILTHLYGMPARMDALTDVAEKYEIPLIEDAAEALGSEYKGRHLGTMGEMGILSFNGNKIITTSGGGALISDNKNYCDHALFLATQARDQAPWYQHSHIGFNYRMSNIAAGIGRGQMEVLPDRIKQRRNNFFFYKNALGDIDEITFLEEPDNNYFSNHWLTTFTINPETKNPEALRQYLQEYNIETRPLWKPMHLQPVFKDAPAYTDGTSEQLFGKGLCLPSSSNLTDEERNFVVEKIREYFVG